MNIVIFGCDNSGKTTLGKVLDDFLGGYIHSPGPLDNIEDMKEFIESNLDKSTVNIFDRFPPIEEYACGTVLRNENKFEDEYEYVREIFDKIDLFIYCCPDLGFVCNWGSRDQMDGIKENIDKLREKYDDIYLSLLIAGKPIVKYDYNKQGRYIKYQEVDN